LNLILKGVVPFWAFSALSGCATIVKGTIQKIAINTPGAPGAQCRLTSSEIGTKNVVTPAIVTVSKSRHPIAMRCTKRCYQEGTGIVASNTEAMTAGNIIAGGVIGLGIDAASGAMNKYNSRNDITMVPIQGCRG